MQFQRLSTMNFWVRLALGVRLPYFVHLFILARFQKMGFGTTVGQQASWLPRRAIALMQMSPTCLLTWRVRCDVPIFGLAQATTCPSQRAWCIYKRTRRNAANNTMGNPKGARGAGCPMVVRSENPDSCHVSRYISRVDKPANFTG